MGGTTDSALPFERFRASSARLDPGADFARTDVPVEVRRDPITGETVHLAHFGAVHPQPLDLARYADPAVKGFCPFCPPHREKVTPRFDPDLIPEGRLTRGEALLVPNLYPYDVHSTVVVLTRKHVVPLEGLTRKRLADAFILGTETWRRLAEADPERPYPVMGWNYMPPSGGGLVHPHQQYLLTRFPGRRYVAELTAARAFFRTHGTDPFTALAGEEARQGERFLGTTGGWQWTAAFAPRGILGEIAAVLPGATGLEALDGAAVEGLVEGLLRVFAWMISDGIFSFNASLFAGPPGEPSFPAHLSLVPRTFLNLRDMAPDMNFLQVLMEEPVSVVLPEELARSLAPWFGSDVRS